LFRAVAPSTLYILSQVRQSVKGGNEKFSDFFEKLPADRSSGAGSYTYITYCPADFPARRRSRPPPCRTRPHRPAVRPGSPLPCP